MKTIQVAAAIICRDNQIFATQRGYGRFQGGWEFPGGKIEEGEDPVHAVIREVKEELDTEISVQKLYYTLDYDYPDFHLHMLCYLCRIQNGKLTLLEHQDARWLTREELDSVDWLPADIQLIEALKEAFPSEPPIQSS